MSASLLNTVSTENHNDNDNDNDNDKTVYLTLYTIYNFTIICMIWVKETPIKTIK